jgi:hypothetical protein
MDRKLFSIILKTEKPFVIDKDKLNVLSFRFKYKDKLNVLSLRCKYKDNYILTLDPRKLTGYLIL